MNRNGGDWQLAVHNRGITFQLARVREENDLYVFALLMQSPRRDETVAAVVTFAAENHNPSHRVVMSQDVLRDGRTRVLHQCERRHAEALAGGAVDSAHFRRGYDFHEGEEAVCSSCRNWPGSPMAIRQSPCSMRSSGAGLKRMSSWRLMASTITPRSCRMRELSIVLPANVDAGVICISPISRSIPRCVVAVSKKLTTCGRKSDCAIRCPANE